MTFKKEYKLTVLAIDGGGIRGIVPAMILAKIEEETRKPIHELFDLIAGTSTGGILSLGLVKPNEPGEEKISAQDLANLYEDEREKIFKKQENLYLPAPLGILPLKELLAKLSEFLGSLNIQINPQELLGPKFTRQEKSEVIKKWLGETPLKQALTEVIITSYAIDERKPILFTSNPRKAEESKSENFRRICSGYKMYHAAMATSAAPTFFKPYEPDFVSNDMTKHLFVDGGVIANNPTSIAIVEARTTYFNEMGKRINPEDILVVSLGTGAATMPFSKKTERWGLIQWVKPLINIVFTGQSEIITYQMEHLLLDEQYYRFQFDCRKRPQSIDSVQYCYVNEAMDDTSKENIEELKKVAKNLIREKSSKLDKLCEVLKAALETRELPKKKKNLI